MTLAYKSRAYLLAFLLLPSCASIHDGNSNFGAPVSEINQKPIAEAQRFVADKTLMTYDPGALDCIYTTTGKYLLPFCTRKGGHGTQVEYLSPRGRAYLWYPGNRGPVPAYWKLKKEDERYEICFLYPSSSYNPETRMSGGNWSCRDLAKFAASIREIRDNDIFQLSEGEIPFVLRAGPTTFDNLLKEASAAKQLIVRQISGDR